MNKITKKDNGIKNSISKLFILRDSCVGTSITQKDNPNIIWFEGAAILLEEGVDQLRSAKNKMDSGGTDASKDFSLSVKDAVSKLIVLKNSCRGDSSLDESDENTNWFAGAESIICEAIDCCMPVAMMVTLPSKFYEDKYGCSGIDFLIFKPFGYKEVLWLVSEAFQYSLKLRKAS